MDSLIDQASKLLRQASSEDAFPVAAQMMPDITQWSAATEPLLRIRPNPALAMTSSLGGAVYMVDQKSTDTDSLIKIPRDSNGYCPALRMALYVRGMLKNSDIFQFLSTEQRTNTVSYMILVLNLANDNLGLHGANDLWNIYDPEVEEEMSLFVSQTQAVIADWLKLAPSSDSNSSMEVEAVRAAQHRFLEESRGLSAASYNHAQAFTFLQSELSELQGPGSRMPVVEPLLKDLRRSPDVFSVVALVTAFKPHNESVRLCNELISGLTGFKILQGGAEGMCRAFY